MREGETQIVILKRMRCTEAFPIRRDLTHVKNSDHLGLYEVNKQFDSSCVHLPREIQTFQVSKCVIAEVFWVFILF
jgi:hypothetical protein